MLHHYALVCERFGPAKGTILMRKYACCYAQGRPGARRKSHRPATDCAHAVGANKRNKAADDLRI